MLLVCGQHGGGQAVAVFLEKGLGFIFGHQLEAELGARLLEFFIEIRVGQRFVDAYRLMRGLQVECQGGKFPVVVAAGGNDTAFSFLVELF